MTLGHQITRLLEGQDNSELIGNQIAAILVVESEQQQLIAEEQGKPDPSQWKLRVFRERSNPWEEFRASGGRDKPDDSSPIVNVSFESVAFDQASSNVVERQRGTGVYHIDCYGHGISSDDGGTGHIAGDELASLETQRAMRLVRRILLAGTYTYLGFPRGSDLTPGSSQVVWRRWPRDITMFQPVIGDRPIAHVVAARLALQVDFNEFSPQVEGQPLELLSLVLKDPRNGRVLLAATYEYPVDEES